MVSSSDCHLGGGGQSQQVWPEEVRRASLGASLGGAGIVPAVTASNLSLSGAQQHRSNISSKEQQQQQERGNIYIQVASSNGRSSGHLNPPEPGRRRRSMVTHTSWWRLCSRKHCKFILPSLVLVLVIIVLLIDLALKPDPLDIDHNWVTVRDAQQNSSPAAASAATAATAAARTASPSSSSFWELTIDLVLVVSNPNLSGSFAYYDAGCFLFHDGLVVGSSSIRPGRVPTQRSRNISSTVTARLTDEQADSSVLKLAAETNMTGFVRKWGILRRHYAISSVCEVVVSPRNRSLVGYSCHGK